LTAEGKGKRSSAGIGTEALFFHGFMEDEYEKSKDILQTSNKIS